MRAKKEKISEGPHLTLKCYPCKWREKRGFFFFFRYLQIARVSIEKSVYEFTQSNEWVHVMQIKT